MRNSNPFVEDDTPDGSSFRAVRLGLICIGIGFGLYVVATTDFGRSGATTSPAAATARAPVPAASAAIHNSLVYRTDPDGHVRLDGHVNGTSVNFLVDTGATLVTLAPRDAAAIGLDPARLAYTAALSTANGSVRAAPVTLREVRVGQLTMEDVSAVVVENLRTSLLGMSFLSRLDGWEMRDGALTISW
jgi:aspartyl protease family protein